MMKGFVDCEQMRMVAVSALSPVLGYYTPTGGFILALVLMFAFNLWAGMRADGISITNCHNFSFRKFKNALIEVFLYLLIIEIVYTIMVSVGDSKAALVVIKSLTYVFMYVYMQNAFKNLIISYPRNVAVRLIYHVIRLEFARAMPSHIQKVIERLEGEISKIENTQTRKK